MVTDIPKPKVTQDLFDYVEFLDNADDTHGALALGTDQPFFSSHGICSNTSHNTSPSVHIGQEYRTTSIQGVLFKMDQRLFLLKIAGEMIIGGLSLAGFLPQ